MTFRQSHSLSGLLYLLFIGLFLGSKSFVEGKGERFGV
jgi:hypothetical protein